MNADFEKVDEKIAQSMAKYNVTYLELLRNLAVDCDQFILFVRDKSFGSQSESWPDRSSHLMCGESLKYFIPMRPRCGTLFSTLPILTPFGTCFTSHPNYSLVATSTGVTERLTIILSTRSTIHKGALWLQDEALRSGVFFALSR